MISIGFHGIIRDITPQKLAEEKIRDQNAFLNNVIESLAHPFMVIDAADCEVVIANAAARNQKEKTDGPCYQMCHEYEVPCSRAGRTCPLEEVARTRRPVHLEHEHDGGKDNPRQHETHAFPLFDEKALAAAIREGSCRPAYAGFDQKADQKTDPKGSFNGNIDNRNIAKGCSADAVDH